MNYKTFAAASLAIMVSTSYAYAQCSDCAQFPERDHLNGGVQVPAAKMGLQGPGGAAPGYHGSNAYAGIRDQYLLQSGAPGTTVIRRRHSRAQ